MGEILGIGLSHYPPFCGADEDMADILRYTLDDPDIPAAEKDPANWPEAMRHEWGNDGGTAGAGEHRAAAVANFDRLRATLDDFAPDLLVIWGDDQYENFKEDIVPPYTVCAYDDLEIRPWADAADSSAMVGKANVWGEGGDTCFTIRGRPEVARELAGGLLDDGIDVAYSYRPLHHKNVGHAFVNAILYLDYHRKGFDYPVITFPLNCYGRRVISHKAFLVRFALEAAMDPPSPRPSRFMELGAATARYFRAGPLRVALIASSSWSHAFLCDKNHRLRPDTESDLRLYEALLRNDYDACGPPRLHRSRMRASRKC